MDYKYHHAWIMHENLGTIFIKHDFFVILHPALNQRQHQFYFTFLLICVLDQHCQKIVKHKINETKTECWLIWQRWARDNMLSVKLKYQFFQKFSPRKKISSQIRKLQARNQLDSLFVLRDSLELFFILLEVSHKHTRRSETFLCLVV